MIAQNVTSFDDWRMTARRYLRQGLAPDSVMFSPAETGQGLLNLPDDPPEFETREPVPHGSFPRVPAAFLELARVVACHRDERRWDLLYRLLWRLTHGEPDLLEIAVDDDVHRARQLEKAVHRDAHKAKAFVRFRRLETDSGDLFIAWHHPDHRVLRLIAPFFSRRFPEMRWSILTPDESVLWDGQELHFGEGVPASEAPSDDHLEDLWRTYYGAIFNPARIKLKAMTREMPVRHWATLPETRIIPDLLRDAPARVDAMHKATQGQPTSAAEFLPESRSLKALHEASKHCEGCDLHLRATQTVFGEGLEKARVVLVGEQPGDQEDLSGKPFVGPAGQVLDEALAAAGISRSDAYITNAVKHFYWEERGTRRLHKKPPARAISACRPWLEAELQAIEPEVLVCLGATASQAIIGRDARIQKDRGKVLESRYSAHTIMTWHPSAILRAPDHDAREKMRQELVNDLTTAKNLLGSVSGTAAD